MPEKVDGCVKPATGPILPAPPLEKPQIETPKEAKRMQARVGKPAPDFELSAYVGGGFKNIKLSDYKGKWIMICFYPGDFTYV